MRSKALYIWTIAVLLTAIALTPLSADQAADCNGGQESDRSAANLARIEACSVLLQRNPRNANAYFKRGKAYYNNYAYIGNTVPPDTVDLAVADLTKAIEINPRNGDFYYWRATAQRYQAFKMEVLGGDHAQLYRRAIEDYSKSIELSPKNKDSYIYRALTYKTLGDKDRAIADLRKYITLTPDNSAAKDHLRALGVMP